MIVRIGMSTSGGVACFMAKDNGFPICVIFYGNPIPSLSELKIVSLNSIRRSNENFILWFIGIRFPLSTIGAAAALEGASNPERFYCITFRAICPADFEGFKIFICKSGKKGPAYGCKRGLIIDMPFWETV